MNEEEQMRMTVRIIIGIVLLLTIAAITSGCKTKQKLPVVTSEDFRRTEIIHTERIDTVFIEIPSQSAERITQESESFLETEFAESFAAINADGTLKHTLRNKDSKHSVMVKTTTDTIFSEKIIEKPYPVEVPVEVEKKLTWWQRTRLNTWWWITAVLAICVAWIFRKPFFTILRKIVLPT